MGYTMAQADSTDELFDSLDAFFDAADRDDRNDIQAAAENLVRTSPAESEPIERGRRTTTGIRPGPPPNPSEEKAPGRSTSVIPYDAATELGNDDIDPFGDMDQESLEGKFVAIDPDTIPGGATGKEPFILIPAHIHSFVPWWGWLTIGFGLAVLIAAVVMFPGVSLNRTISRLGDSNPATAQQAMRQLVMKGDERAVGKLYDLASSPRESVRARLRAVDTMSLIERVPEVDRALLRLELSSGTNNQVREAAIAARKQREAYKTRGRRQ